jgi:anti-sigma regulatory factor (Ser/Thr protein kinase)
MYERATLADPPRLWEQPYPGTTDQVRHVRAAVREFLGGCPAAADAVQLLSELSANAIAHSGSGSPGGTFTVRVQDYPGSYVWGEVEDQGSTWDGNLSRSARRPHGLYLLTRLASDCGVEQVGHAHVVWFRLDYGSRRSSASAAGLPGRDDLTPRIFRALYRGFELRTLGAVHIVTPKGAPVFISGSLGQIACQISDHEHGTAAARSPRTPPGDHLPARVPRS